jgi:DNA-binding CsgD family transcriptional regulator
MTDESLVVRCGNTIQLIRLIGRPVTIGRREGTDLRFADDLAVSRLHAVIERFDLVWRIRDLGSRNGTFVNEIKVDEPVRLTAGDSIQVGESKLSVTFAAEAHRQLLITKLADTAENPPLLSPREREILRLVANGSRDGEIAERLSISIRTVQSHLDRIRNKCGIRRRADLTRFAINLGIAD